MNAQTVIRTALLADATVAGLITTGSEVRYYAHDAVPQALTRAAISYQRISKVSTHDLDGGSVEPEPVRIQLNMLATTALAASNLAFEVERIFRRGYSASGVLLIRMAGHGDLPREPESKLFGVRIDLLATLGAAEAA